VSDAFFVYGTLRPGRAPAALADVVATLRRVGSGRLRGRLWDLGPHPGGCADPAAPGWIHGDVVERTAASPPLAWFDAYEEFDPAAPDRSPFRRERHPIETEDGRVECWVYLLAREPDGRPLVAGGEWKGPAG
jgi:gamma-glutamylcyclotransferase (GGCT)/AIG2-like uncharacterized protein YtfP